MKKILVLAATIVGLVTIFEVGLLLFPWTYSPHLVSRPLTLAEKNQRLWERFAPVPLWATEAVESQDTETEDLVGRVARLETRIAQLERQVASQNPVIARLRSTSSYPSYELQELRSEIDSLRMNPPTRICQEFYGQITC